MKKVVADILTKKVIFFMFLCCADIVMASMHRGLSKHQKRLIAPHRWGQGDRSTQEPIKIHLEENAESFKQALREVRLSEQVFEDFGLRGVLKGHQRDVASEEKTFETKTQIVFIQGCPPELQSLCLQIKKYQLGLEFARCVMQPQSDFAHSFKAQKKLEQLFTLFEDDFNQDVKRKKVSFVALCLERDRKRDLAVLEFDKEDRRDFRALRTEKALPMVAQKGKQQMDQFKQSRKQEQKRLKQQQGVTFQKNKKLPKSQQQVKQVAHRKRG